MLETCGVCGEATERGTCDECRQADRSQHKTRRAQAILNVLNTPGKPGFAWGGDVTPFESAIGGPTHIDDPLTAEQTKNLGTDWIDRAYRSQRRD